MWYNERVIKNILRQQARNNIFC